jgi:hypothetical protein
VVLRERSEDRHDLECAAQPTVDVQQRRPGTELEQLRLALGPADSADASVRRVPGEQRGLYLREFPIQLCFQMSPSLLRRQPICRSAVRTVGPQVRIAAREARSIGGNTYPATGLRGSSRSAYAAASARFRRPSLDRMRAT